MYFPYLRGRQNELIAIRELVDMGRLSKRVIPIIEPVKMTSTLISTLSSCIEKNYHVGLIVNPCVGGFLEEYENTENEKFAQEFQNIVKNDIIYKSIVMNDEYQQYESYFDRANTIIINADHNSINRYTDTFIDIQPKYTLIPDNRSFRRKIKTNCILFEDRFVQQEKNSAYGSEPEFFSEDHLYYGEEGFVGFADYSIAGKKYSESGFAPRSVAIHIVYFDKEEILKIRHFVSEQSFDIKNTAGKFYEALEKLVFWYNNDPDAKHISTYGLDILLEHYKQKTYPGLGPIKKIAIMHHLELMSQYLDRND